ncbi:MAG: hypothetical protein K6F07_01790 [Bacilli bacterium]|nr:hypothetical protein [Bacilli bacterium]
MKTKILPSFLSLGLLAGMAASVTGCSPSWRNQYAYDLDFNVDVNGTTIQMWTGFGTNINDEMAVILDEFQKLTGVKVEYESKGSYDNVLSATGLSATSGKFPHVVVGYPDHFASYVKQDIIVRLDYYFENDVHNDTFEPQGEDFELNDFYADYMAENQAIEFDANGNPYTLGVPFNKSTEVLIYNKTFFDWCATQDDLKNQIYVPATYDQVDQVGKAILNLLDARGVYNNYLWTDGQAHTSAPTDPKQLVLNLSGIFKWGTSGKANKDCFKPFSYDSQANLFITSVRQNGGTYTYLDKATNKGYIGFDSQEAYNALTKLNNLYENNTFGIPADWDEAKYGSNPFKAQKTVMTLGSSAGVTNDAPSGNAFDIASAPVPYFSADKKFVISQGANLALLDKGSREQRVASWQLVKFLTKYANGYLCAKTSYYPTCLYAEKGGMWAGASDDFQDYLSFITESVTSVNTTERIKGQTALVNTNYYVNADEKWTKFVDQPFAGSASIRTEVAAIPGYVFLENKTPQEAISIVKKKLNDYVKQ